MHPDLALATQALRDNDLAKAEALIRACLAKQPANAEGLKLLAHIAAATGFVADAEQLLRKATAIKPAFVEANADLASLLCRLERAEEGAAMLDRAIARFPGAV
ncbi:tetratricopeptide repeat protein [Novosphingobium sp.]|uniref:tetratricopeptide repeat protein n=1 Tax=Novosphingobium sp. TaxID=1874826 RepID=UPI002FDB58D4